MQRNGQRYPLGGRCKCASRKPWFWIYTSPEVLEKEPVGHVLQTEALAAPAAPTCKSKSKSGQTRLQQAFAKWWSFFRKQKVICAQCHLLSCLKHSSTFLQDTEYTSSCLLRQHTTEKLRLTLAECDVLPWKFDIQHSVLIRVPTGARFNTGADRS